MSSGKEINLPVGIIGSGIMGRGIAQLFAWSGHTVWLYDENRDAMQAARDFVFSMFDRMHEKERISAEERDACRARLHLAEDPAGLGQCKLVIEAIIEDLAIKKTLFAELEAILDDDAVIASNTSSLLISDIASACREPGRVCGLHFFNPVPLMKVVEVIPGVRTSPRTVKLLTDTVSATGHRAVVAADQPGFLVNHAGRGYYTEALKVLEEGVASVVDIDNVMRESMGFRMGPFELMDLTGLDVSGKVMQSIYDQFLQEPWYRPSSLVAPRLAAGLFGRKTGAGFYDYDGNDKQVPAAQAPPAGTLSTIFPVAETDPVLLESLQQNGADIVDSAADSETILLLQPWGKDLSAAAAAAGYDAARCVAVDPLPEPDTRRTLMLTPVTRADIRDSAHALLARDGVPVTVINDSPGFISQRILAMIVNIAANIAQRRIAAVTDIEDAVRLGLGYPHGPLTWGDIIGADRIATILNNMHALTGDPRYRCNPWLRRRVDLGLSLLQQEVDRN